MSSAYDREMRKALQADAEKLEQLTGEPQPFHVDEGFFDIWLANRANGTAAGEGSLVPEETSDVANHVSPAEASGPPAWPDYFIACACGHVHAQQSEGRIAFSACQYCSCREMVMATVCYYKRMDAPPETTAPTATPTDCRTYNISEWGDVHARTTSDGRVIFEPKTVSELTAFLFQIEREVKWVRGLLVTEGDKANLRDVLDTPEMAETLAKLAVAPVASSATPTPGPTHNTLMEEIAATASASYWAARLASSQQEVERLKAVIERDRTRFGMWIERLRAETRSRWGMATSRGSYEWDDDGYRKEFAAALTAFEKALDRVFEEVYVRDLTDSPTTDKAVQEARRALTTEPR